MTKAATTTLGMCLALLLALTGAPPAIAEDSSRAQRIEELLELTGSGDIGVQVMHGMIASMKQSLPQVPEEWWEAFMARTDPDDLNRMVVPIYERHFTDQEIDAMIDFYRSPLGRSIISKMPVVVQESMAVGQTWGRRLAEEVLRDLREDGYELPAGLQSS